MIFIDLGLLRSLCCKISYLLKSTEVVQIWEFDNLHMTQCAKIIVGFTANVGNVFLSNVYKRFFYFLHVFNVVLTFLTFFLFSSQCLLHLWCRWRADAVGEAVTRCAHWLQGTVAADAAAAVECRRRCPADVIPRLQSAASRHQVWSILHRQPHPDWQTDQLPRVSLPLARSAAAARGRLRAY